MKDILIYIILLVMAASYAKADDSVYLNKDDKAPYAGILITSDKLQELKNSYLELGVVQQINDSLNKSVNLQHDIIEKKDEQLKLYLDQNDKLAKTLQSEQGLSTWERVGYIILGVAITGLAIDGVHQLYK